MCEPMSIIGFALSAASGMAEMAAQQQAADNQNRLYEQNRLNAIAAFQDKQNAMNNRISQERESAATQQFDNSLDAQKARATNAVAAGESNISGNSVEALQRDIFAREQRMNDRIGQQKDWTIAQIQAEKKGQSYEALDRINSVRRAEQPNFIGGMLKIAAGGLSAAAPKSKSRTTTLQD